MKTRREIIKSGLGLAGIIAAGKAPAALVRSLVAGRHIAATGTRLPYDTEVEYLESNGNQYIKLGIDNINTNLACDVVCRCLSPNANNRWAFGDYSNNNFYNFIYGQYSSQLCITVGGTGGGFFYCGNRDENDHRIRINRDNGIWFDDTLKHEGNVYQTHQTITHNICLFGSHQTHARGSTIYNIPCRIYSRHCKFWYGDTLVRDIRTVIDFNGVACLYDRARPEDSPNGDGLYYNAGTGAFVIGPVKARGASGQNGGGISG